MRKLMVLVTVAVMVIAGYAAAQTITGSAHNLGSGGTDIAKSTNSDEICVFCHTPHQPAGTTTDPLWNHTLSSQASYGMYSSATFNTVGYVSDIADVGLGTAVSNLCLSCHDGTIAVNSQSNPPNAIGNVNPTMNGPNAVLNASQQIIGSALIGVDLTNDHPINMTYDDVTFTGLRADTAGASVTFGGNTVPLFNGKVQCASCHNPHDDTNTPFLRVTISGSTLCLVCHNK